MKSVLRFFAVAVALLVVAVGSFAADAAKPAAKPADRYKFNNDTVPELARRLAAGPRKLRSIDSNSPLRQLTYDQYRDIRVNPDSAIWRNEQVPMRLDLLPAGFLFKTPVAVSVAESSIARDLIAPPSSFVLGPSVVRQLRNTAVPLSGLRVLPLRVG